MGTLHPGVDCPPLPQANIDYVHRDEIMRNCFQYPLEGLSETSNNQALLIPFIITWKWGKVSPSTTGKFWLYSYGRAFRNFKWSGSSQSLLSLHKNESIHEVWGEWGLLVTSPRGRDMKHCFQYPLEGHSETSNDQALLNPFYHCIKMKAYMRFEGSGDTSPRGRLSPPTTGKYWLCS